MEGFAIYPSQVRRTVSSAEANNSNAPKAIEPELAQKISAPSLVIQERYKLPKLDLALDDDGEPESLTKALASTHINKVFQGKMKRGQDRTGLENPIQILMETLSSMTDVELISLGTKIKYEMLVLQEKQDDESITPQEILTLKTLKNFTKAIGLTRKEQGN